MPEPSKSISKPIPSITPDMQEFFAGTREGRLMVQQCGGCGALRFPAYEICSKCNSTKANWVQVSGRGTVYSFNIMHQLYHPAFATEVPYAVVVVELIQLAARQAGPQQRSKVPDRGAIDPRNAGAIVRFAGVANRSRQG